MECKKFCLVLSRYFEQVKGGAEYQAYLFAQRLVELGHEVHYIYVDVGQSFHNSLPISLHGIQWGALKKRLPRYGLMLDAWKVRAILKEIDPDVIYQRAGSAYTGIAARYARETDKCFIWHIANETDVTPVPSSVRNLLQGKLLEKLFIRRGMESADLIVAQAASQAEMILAHYGVQASAVVPNFHPIPDEEIEKPDDRVDVVWVANFKPQKQPERFIELVRAFRTRADVRFWMAGRRDMRGAADILQSAAGLANLQYLGELKQEEVNRLLARAHIFINTSKYEGFPNTFVQAWLRNVPVISLHVNPDEVLTREGIGFCSGSLEGMISDCTKLIESPKLRKDMGTRARLYAENVHAIVPNVDRILELVKAWERDPAKRTLRPVHN